MVLLPGSIEFESPFEKIIIYFEDCLSYDKTLSTITREIHIDVRNFHNIHKKMKPFSNYLIPQSNRDFNLSHKSRHSRWSCGCSGEISVDSLNHHCGLDILLLIQSSYGNCMHVLRIEISSPSFIFIPFLWRWVITNLIKQNRSVSGAIFATW